MRDEYDFEKSKQNPYAKKFDDIVESAWVNSLAKLIKKFKSSTSYWGVILIVILFIIRESIGYSITVQVQKYLEGSDYTWLLTVVEFIFGIGGSWELALGGLLVFLILSLVKVSEGENNTISLKESFLSLLLLLTLVGMGIYVISSNSTSHNEIHKQQKIANDKLDKIEALLKLKLGDETAFLEKYFGKNYAVILKHPQTYHNFTTLLKQTNKTADELLKEQEELLKKIESQSFSPKLKTQIDKAFKELRYEDVRELIDIFLEANDAKEQEIINAHYIKALTYMEQIRYLKAKEEFEKIAPNIDNVLILSDYARMYYILGKYDKAIIYYKKVLEIQIFRLGENNPAVATSYNNIGSIWQSKGEYNKSIEYYEKALKIQESIVEKNYPDIAISYNNIGLSWKEKGEYAKATEYYEKALKIQISIFRENHPSTAASYNNIGSLWQSKGKYSKAIEYYEKALKIQISIFGENHPSTAASYNNIGSLWESKGEYDKALEYYEKALKLKLEILGENHPNIAVSYNNIGLLWDKKREYDKAIKYQEKALKITLIVLGQNHPDTAISYNNLGLSCKGKGEYNKALEYYKKALKIQIGTLGENHIDTIKSYNNIGSVWKSKGEYDRAMVYYEKALKIQISIFGEIHSFTAAIYNNIGSLWYSKRAYNKSIVYYEKTLKILRELFPNGHPYIDLATESLDMAKESLKNN